MLPRAKPLVLVRPLLTRLTRDARATSRRPRGGAPHPVDAVGCAAKLGVVPVSEASVIIALSSAHRKEGIEALHWAIDELKVRRRGLTLRLRARSMPGGEGGGGWGGVGWGGRGA